MPETQPVRFAHCKELSMTVKFLDLNAQYQTIRAEIDSAIAAVIADCAFIGGKYATIFEAEFAAYQGAGFCVGVGNGTDALEIALESLGLPPGSEVIVPANSFIATSEAVTRSGHRVVFCDCNPDDYTFSVTDAERRITPSTRAVIPVHLYGRPCNMDAVMAFAAQHNLRVIEDCAQAHGAEYGGNRVGTFGDAGTFSFYPGKNLGAYGDAGAIVTNNESLAVRCRMIANHGRIGKYDHEFEGRNSRLDGIQAAILSVKLRHLDLWTGRRVAVAGKYRRLLSGCHGIILPVAETPGMHHVYHLFVIRARQRDRLQAFLKGEGIECGVHYPVSLPRLAAYRHDNRLDEQMFANQSCDELLSLPIGEHLNDADVERVAEAVNRFFSSHMSDTTP